MNSTYILYNPLAGKRHSELELRPLLDEFLRDTDAKYINMTEINDYVTFLGGLAPADVIWLCGGDGTINRFVNATKDINFNNDIYYYAIGTGNDFLNDLEKKVGCPPIKINEYIDNLPVVNVNGASYKFINGVGYGIDGYCCEEADKIRAKTHKKVNYTKIALKGLLFYYKPTTAKIKVDGKEFTYRKVWLAPTMNGRFFGGGMMATPGQNRLNKERTVSLMVGHDLCKFKIVLLFATIFKGKHVKYTKNVTTHVGHDITVAFDRPVALQIDGETVLNVTEYNVQSGKDGK